MGEPLEIGARDMEFPRLNLMIVGDVQGHLEPLRGVLRAADLVNDAGHWSGGEATLVVLGDLVDRGPDGIGVIEFLMHLQDEGRVEVVIGNHDILFLAAHKFGGSYLAERRDTGGIDDDLSRLRDEHVEWLQNLPAIAREGDVLMMHADALFYLDYGSDLDEVNASFRSILLSDDADEWHRLLDVFREHRAFLPPEGCAQLERVLSTFGGTRLVHGHTPIARMLNRPAQSVTGAYVYCGGRCVNVDPGFYLGGPGFCYRA